MQQQSLECGVIVFRAMPRKNWFDPATQCVSPAAFLRRPSPKDEKGLSVDVVSPGSCASVLRDCYGVLSLHVGRMRDLGLNVVIDESPHANITGVPRSADDQTLAERLASQLAKQARFIPPQQYQPANS
jgi:hypothetical protein